MVAKAGFKQIDDQYPESLTRNNFQTVNGNIAKHLQQEVDGELR
jgi:hypothetical protein